MFFAADIGNTNITIGIFSENSLIETKRIETDKKASVKDFELKLQNLFANYSFENGIIGSVVDEITDNFKEACDNIFGINTTILSADMDLGIGLKTDNPKSIGADRLANVIGALNYKLPAIIVDIGTAITFDIIDSNKVFVGGVIMPGINMGLKSLHDGTSKLPIIEKKDSPCAIGYDTETCILSGVIRGIACAIDGLIDQCEKELGEKALIVVTGGQSGIISKYMKSEFIINGTLTLDGLKTAFDKTNNASF